MADFRRIFSQFISQRNEGRENGRGEWRGEREKKNQLKFFIIFHFLFYINLSVASFSTQIFDFFCTIQHLFQPVGQRTHLNFMTLKSEGRGMRRGREEERQKRKENQPK